VIIRDFVTEIVIMFLLPDVRSVRCETDLLTVSQYSDWATEWTAEGSGFCSRQGQSMFLFSTSTRPALGHTQPLSSDKIKLSLYLVIELLAM
jgi:hypothetical protein